MTRMSAAVEKGINFGSTYSLRDFFEEINSKKVVFFGEMHSIEAIVQMETALAMAMLARYQVPEGEEPHQVLHIVMEHFSFEMQSLLDDYQNGFLTLEQLNEEYARIGTEGHDIMAYKELLEFSKKYSNIIKLHGGFIPRTYAKMIMRESEEQALEQAKQLDYIPSGVTSFEGTDLHYNMFESMISQRNMYDRNMQPSDSY